MRTRSIRPLEPEDIPQVASLYERIARSGSDSPPPGLAAYFRRTFLEPPNADPGVPSLVYLDADGRVAGFIGSSVRPMVFDGDRIRVGVCGQLVTEPKIRNQAAGTFLMREYMNGPQDLTLTDTASGTVRRIWEGIGGETSQLACMGWVRLFRPWRVGGALLSRQRRFQTVAPAVRPLLGALDALTVRVPGTGLRPARPETSGEPLTPGALARLLPTLAASSRLRPDYCDAFAAWLLDEIAAVRTRGPLIARLVRDAGGAVQGSYIYYLPPGGIGEVLHVAGRERDIGRVLDDLFDDAWSRGASAVQGRVEAHLRDALSQRGCVFRAAGYLALLQSRRPEVLHAIQAGQALLTRLDGEWWMGHHLERFDGAEAA